MHQLFIFALRSRLTGIRDAAQEMSSSITLRNSLTIHNINIVIFLVFVCVYSAFEYRFNVSWIQL